PKPQPVLVAGRHLARPQRAARAALEAQQDLRVVVEPAARDKARQVGTHRVEREPRDEAGEMVGVRADVAQRAARSRLRRIGAPGRLLLARRPPTLGEPVLDIVRLPGANVAELARGDHGARLADEGIAGVVVRHREELPRLLRQANQVAGFGGRRRSRASARVVASAWSRMTCMPARRNVPATDACRWLGVTIVTTSMPSSRAASAAAIAWKSPYARSGARPSSRADCFARVGSDDRAPATST